MKTKAITYQVAMAAGQDAANKRMKAAGRTKWNQGDYAEAARVTSMLLQWIQA
jgi:hypothetical protein